MKKIYFIIALLVVTAGGAMAQDKTQNKDKARNEAQDKETAKRGFEKSTADSSHIAVNKKGGWQSVISHLTALKQDSVLLELVVGWPQAETDLTREQLVGRIKLRSMLPAKPQTVLFRFIRSDYALRIEPNGRCYIQLVKGTPPKSDQQVIPIRAKYRKN